MKRIVLEEEDKGASTSNKFVPKAVSKVPVITRQPWDPVLGDSVHAFAWWTLSKEETVAVIKEQEGRALKRPAPQIVEQPPASKRVQSPRAVWSRHPLRHQRQEQILLLLRKQSRPRQRLLKPRRLQRDQAWQSHFLS